MATTWADYLKEHQDRFLGELIDFLRIPSISSLPDHKGDVERAAVWVAHRLETAGMEKVQILPTGGHPVVYAEWLHAPGQPTILIYGHFDTQPVDPLHLWTRPPFEPVVENDRVYARGATDDKGNMFVPILALEALLETTGRLPVNVKCFFEGQEEIGSPQVPDFLSKHRELFACDLVVSADGGQYSEDQSGLTVGSKGLCALQIDMYGAKKDLHSGGHGGAVQNPIHAMVRLLDSMRGPDGNILVEGFYDTVVDLTDEDRQLIAAVPFDESDYKAKLGIPDVFGEPGYTTVERRWARPTLELNGIWSGFQGEGVKTVLPNEAHAKITCRLVADQDPERIVELITAHVQKHAPVGVRTVVTRQPGQAKPYLMPKDHWANVAASGVLRELYGKEPYYVRTGGTIPVCELFQTQLGAYTVNFAFGLDDENVHAPDEFYRLSSFRRAQKAYCMLLERLAK